MTVWVSLIEKISRPVRAGKWHDVARIARALIVLLHCKMDGDNILFVRTIIGVVAVFSVIQVVDYRSGVVTGSVPNYIRRRKFG